MLKLSKIQRRSDAKSAARSAASKSGASADTPLTFGVTVHIEAQIDGVFASSRAVTLEQKGVILRTEIDPPAGHCGALLKPQQVKRGETASVVVIFELAHPFPWSPYSARRGVERNVRSPLEIVFAPR